MTITEEEVYKLIESIFKQERKSLSRETLVENFAKDSMDTMEFIAVLESTYGVKVDPSEIVKLKNIGEIVDYAKEHQAATGSKT